MFIFSQAKLYVYVHSYKEHNTHHNKSKFWYEFALNNIRISLSECLSENRCQSGWHSRFELISTVVNVSSKSKQNLSLIFYLSLSHWILLFAIFVSPVGLQSTWLKPRTKSEDTRKATYLRRMDIRILFNTGWSVLLTLKCHSIWYTQGLDLMLHSRYTSAFSLIIVVLRLDPSSRFTIGLSDVKR